MVCTRSGIASLLTFNRYNNNIPILLTLPHFFQQCGATEKAQSSWGIYEEYFSRLGKGGEIKFAKNALNTTLMLDSIHRIVIFCRLFFLFFFFDGDNT